MPYITLALDGTRQGGDVVIVKGEAELLSEQSRDMGVSVAAALGEKYAALIKAMGADLERMAEDYSQPIRIRPTKFLTWSS